MFSIPWFFLWTRRVVKTINYKQAIAKIQSWGRGWGRGWRRGWRMASILWQMFGSQVCITLRIQPFSPVHHCYRHASVFFKQFCHYLHFLLILLTTPHPPPVQCDAAPLCRNIISIDLFQRLTKCFKPRILKAGLRDVGKQEDSFTCLCLCSNYNGVSCWKGRKLCRIWPQRRSSKRLECGWYLLNYLFWQTETPSVLQKLCTVLQKILHFLEIISVLFRETKWIIDLHV